MRALRYDRYGTADVLYVADLPEPVPAGGEAKVRVRAASLNPLDWKIRAGHVRLLPMFRAPPRGIGRRFRRRDRRCRRRRNVAASRRARVRIAAPFGREGALADYIVVALDRIVPIPENLDDEHAAALPMAGGTALQALTDEAALASGQRVLITGAAGGVGHFAVQIAKHVGAHVVAVCSAGNAEFVRSLGADEVDRLRARRFHAPQRPFRRRVRRRVRVVVRRREIRADRDRLLHQHRRAMPEPSSAPR